MAGTVTVACKLPNGLQLQLQQMREFNEAVMGGGVRTVQRAERVGAVVTIRGFARRFGEEGAPMQGGYALTPGVDAEFFATWMKQNAEHPAVEAGLIFASEKTGDVDRFTRENAKLLSGLEPTDPKNLPPEFRRSIQTAEV